MILKQHFDAESSTYTYILARRAGGEALIIDPVKGQLACYLAIFQQLDVRLVTAIDTHIHADHVTALGDLRDVTGCATIMGELTPAGCVTRRVSEAEILDVDGVKLQAMHTPGHTDESFSFVVSSPQLSAVFTGDVLLIGGTGRTDFQNGDAAKSWDSIVNKLFRLPDATLVYPAHDYHGRKSSSIGAEKRSNPRLAGRTREQYIELMNSLRLPSPALMDVAVPANLQCGQALRQ